MKKIFGMFFVAMFVFMASAQSAFAAKGIVLLKGIERCENNAPCIKYDAISNTSLSLVQNEFVVVDPENQTPTQMGNVVRAAAAVKINEADPTLDPDIQASQINIV